jgi:uncharacterized protein YkwD
VGSRCLIAIVLVAGAIFAASQRPSIEAAPPPRVHDAEGCPQSGAVPVRDHIEVTRGAILCLLNKERARHRLPALAQNAVLQRASQLHSEDMARRDFFEHDNPDGADPGLRMELAGYPRVGTWVGENLYWGEEAEATPVRAVEGWMHSPGHRANILRPEFAEVGVGVAYDAPIPASEHRSAVYTTDFGGLAQP